MGAATQFEGDCEEVSDTPKVKSLVRSKKSSCFTTYRNIYSTSWEKFYMLQWDISSNFVVLLCVCICYHIWTAFIFYRLNFVLNSKLLYSHQEALWLRSYIFENFNQLSFSFGKIQLACSWWQLAASCFRMHHPRYEIRCHYLRVKLKLCPFSKNVSKHIILI